MAKPIDDATLIAWLDGELDDGVAAQVAAAVATDQVLAATADRHHRLKTHSADPFDPIARDDETPSASPPLSATIHSLADTRAKRAPPTVPRHPFR